MPAAVLAVPRLRVPKLALGCGRGLPVIIACAGLVGACSHDLDRLRAKRGAPDAAVDAAAPTSGSGGGRDVLAACRPCQPPTGLSELVTPLACCTSGEEPQCGVSFGANRCLYRNSPGLPDAMCPDLTRAGIHFSGCCRFDLQCGVSLDDLDLGCLSRADVPALLGGPLAPRACVPKCDGDEACTTALDVSICVEDGSHRADSRFCAYSCKSDRDCAAVPDTVCAIQPNHTDQRIDAVCRKPFGPGQLGDECASTDDCAHGVCLNAVGSPYCSQLCQSDLECAGTGSQCKQSTIPVPPPGVGTQTFSVCVARK